MSCRALIIAMNFPKTPDKRRFANSDKTNVPFVVVSIEVAIPLTDKESPYLACNLGILALTVRWSSDKSLRYSFEMK